MNARTHRLVFAALAMLALVALPLMQPNSAAASGSRCFSGLNLMERYVNNEWHWYAYVPVTVSAPLTSWHVHGPRDASLWPDSVHSNYVMVYFSWPHGVNPYLFYNASDWQACLN